MQLYQGDCLDIMPTLQENSVDLIIADPPYFRVLKDKWDHQWKDFEEFLVWLERVIVEMKRILKVNGSVYLFCWSAYSADIQMVMRKHLNVLNEIVWVKGDKAGNGVWNKQCKAHLRRYFPQSERIVFAEQHGAKRHLAREKEKLKRQVYAPLIKYFTNSKLNSNMKSKEIQEKMHSLTGTRYAFQSHTLSTSQWMMPKPEQYAAASTFLDLPRDYRQLRTEYDLLQIQYKRRLSQLDAKRPFFATAEAPYTDVWRFCNIPPGSRKRHHPAQKPDDLLRHIVRMSSREGDVILDPFAGSGSTLRAAEVLSRQAIGIERSEKYCDLIRSLEGQA